MLPLESEKQKERLRQYNYHLMNPIQDVENEQVRAKKRKLKEDLKKVARILDQKAKFPPVNMCLEDLYYLQNCNKFGV